MQDSASGTNIGSILDQTADLIEERGWDSDGGWWEGPTMSEQRPLCLEGGLQCALGEEYSFRHDTGRSKLTHHPAYLFLQKFIGTTSELFNWNDRHAEGQYQVIDVLRAAAKHARSEDDQSAEKQKKQAVKKSIKAVRKAMNDEMDDFESTIQSAEKEMIHV